ncbi:hypothetical protein HN51_061760, partial [Arachis hypogaea]
MNDLMKPPLRYPNLSITFHVHEARAYANKRKHVFGSNVLFYDPDAIAFRTCRGIEGPHLDFVEEQFKMLVLPTGPASWLGEFKQGSVVYCCLGSECRLRPNLFQELLLGLELVGMPFLVALKPPIGFDSVGDALPEGFEERVKGRGIVYGGWIQHQLILEHPSVGCFITHCGS